jgi:hypothetical protein
MPSYLQAEGLFFTRYEPISNLAVQNAPQRRWYPKICCRPNELVYELKSLSTVPQDAPTHKFGHPSHGLGDTRIY